MLSFLLQLLMSPATNRAASRGTIRGDEMVVGGPPPGGTRDTSGASLPRRAAEHAGQVDTEAHGGNRGTAKGGQVSHRATAFSMGTVQQSVNRVLQRSTGSSGKV